MRSHSEIRGGTTVAKWAERLTTYANFVKFEHTVFSLPLIFAGAILAEQGWPAWTDCVLILIAAAGARTAALGLNRIIDHQLDQRNPRTQSRELPTGRMTVKEAWGIVTMGGIIYLGAAALLGPLCVLFAPVPLLLFAGYPYLKRFTMLAHLGLGITWATAPLGGWLAVAKSFEYSMPAWLLALYSCLWVTGFDIIYATLDEASDRETGVHSLPAKIGYERAMNVALGLHVLAFVVLILLYRLELRGGVTFGLLMFAGLLLLMEHIRRDDVEFAFFKVNALLGFVILGMVIAGMARA